MAGIWLVSNVLDNLEERRIKTGFSFLNDRAGFDIAETLVPYTAASSYGRALLVGVLNTLHVAVIAIFLTTILGVVIGVSRVSRNWIVAKLAAVYVETFRNIPVLLQLLAWYVAITALLPPARSALLVLPGVYISKSGLSVPIVMSHPVHGWMMIAMLGGLVLSFLVFWLRRSLAGKSSRIAQESRYLRLGRLLGLVFGPPILVWLIAGAPVELDIPQLGKFRITGGVRASAEFLALMLGLSLYTASFIAEVVRSGIEAVPRGQVEAANALGLRQGQVIRRIVLPQALRVIIPPLTSQYLNLTKNSSLGLAVGYPEACERGQHIAESKWSGIRVYCYLHDYLSKLESCYISFYELV